MTVVTTVCLALLAVSGALYLVRALRPGSLADRIVAVDSLLLTVVAGIAVLTARTDRDDFVTVLVVASLIAFVGTVAVARFIERRGA